MSLIGTGESRLAARSRIRTGRFTPAGLARRCRLSSVPRTSRRGPFDRPDRQKTQARGTSAQRRPPEPPDAGPSTLPSSPAAWPKYVTVTNWLGTHGHSAHATARRYARTTMVTGARPSQRTPTFAPIERTPPWSRGNTLAHRRRRKRSTCRVPSRDDLPPSTGGEALARTTSTGPS